MAEAIVEPVQQKLLETLMEKVTSLITEEFGQIWGVEDDMEKLSNTISVVQDVLQEAQTKRITSQAMESWLAKLQKTVLDANQVMDEWMKTVLDASTNKSCITSVGNFFLYYLSVKQLIFRHNTANKIKELIARFDEIAAERSKFHLFTGIEKKQSFDYNQETNSILFEEVLGREGDKAKVLNMLLSSSEKTISVLPVVGVDGVGKTTLAKLIYNDETVKKHFDVGIWVWVSKNFHVKRTISSILESLDENKCDIKNFDAKQKCLRQLLGGKRYLLVLDDVWNEDEAKWNHLKTLLSNGAKGSAIIVTTPSRSAASIMSTYSVPHYLEHWKVGNNTSTQKVRYQTMASWKRPEGNEEEHD